ncbi:MAG: hypothetical protein U0V48_11105 [Anaerolineales bacterium]
MDLLQLFKVLVMQEFSFLQKKYGFDFSKESDHRFTAKSSRCLVAIDFDKNVIGCWIERLDLPQKHPDRGIGVGWIAQYFGFRDDEIRFLTREESITQQTKSLANQLREYCKEFLLGNFSQWEDIKEFVRKQIEIEEEKEKEQSLQRLVSDVRYDAETAWKDKNYGKVIDQLEIIEEFLTPSEREKLEYAKRHVSSEQE